MSGLYMENLLLRMKRFTSGTAVSFILLSALVACSSKNGAVDTAVTEEVSARDSQEDASLVLGDASLETSSQDNLEAASVDQVSGSDAMSSLPTKKLGSHRRSKQHMSDQQDVKIWRGQLHTQYTSDMKEWKVARGESFSAIADGVFGKRNSLKKLLELNPEIEDPNVLVVGQILRLPVSDESAQIADFSKVPSQKEEAKAAESQVVPQQVAVSPKEEAKADASLTVVSNEPSHDTDPSAVPAESQVGAMETVPVVSAPAVTIIVGQSSVDSGAAPSKLEVSKDSSPMVEKVSNVHKKNNLRTMLLLGAVGFLILSGFVFILGRKKA
jgi:hypothetical protein